MIGNLDVCGRPLFTNPVTNDWILLHAPYKVFVKEIILLVLYHTVIIIDIACSEITAKDRSLGGGRVFNGLKLPIQCKLSVRVDSSHVNRHILHITYSTVYAHISVFT